MKKQNSALEKKLLQYVALAAPIVGMGTASKAQAIYTNIDPDVTLHVSAAGDNYALDLNNDGSTDFNFYAVTGGP